MKNLKNLLLIVIAILGITACEKTEENNFDTISGVLTPGENVTAEDLNGKSIHLAKLYDTVDPTQLTTDMEEWDYIAETTINVDGSFIFNNLDIGNYVLFFSEEFMFAADTIMVTSLDGNNQALVNKAVDRIIFENMQVGIMTDDDPGVTKSFDFELHNNADYGNMKILFYQSGELAYDPINLSDISGGDFSIYLSVNKTRQIQIIGSCSDNNLIESTKLNIPSIWGTKSTSHVTVNNDELKVEIKSCFGYKKITIKD